MSEYLKVEKRMADNWAKEGPWLVSDDGHKREWLVPTPLRYYLYQDKKSGEWSVCDRWWDLEFNKKIRSKRKGVVVRRFYKLVNRPIP